jgi:hypothetical protein
MSERTARNIFNDAVNMDASDLTLRNTMARNMLGMRIMNTHGTSFCVTNIKGTEQKFTLSPGFVPLASEHSNEVLYIISFNPTSLEVEVGSFPSPDYANPGGPNVNVYRPFNNLDDGPFRTTAFGLSTKPKLTDIEIQRDYDGSVNVAFTMWQKTPRIVNSKFTVTSDLSGNRIFEETPDRPGTANSNEYTAASVEKETRQILSSDKILGISFSSVSGGGKLKPGNYVYVFYYMTEDFNKTDIVGQSGLCQVAFGSTEVTVKGGDETQETNKRVVLNLSNIDTDFKYLKVYVLYSSGQETTTQQFLEMTNPLSITGETMVFTHSGFEQVAEVSQDVVNTDYTTIDSAVCNTQIDGYYILAGITERTYDFEPFRTASAQLTPSHAIKDILSGALPGYADPANVYNYLGHFGNESYPYGIVYVMPGNVLSPVFPTKGQLFTASTGDFSVIIASDQANGIVTFPASNSYLPFSSSKPKAKYLKFDVSGIPQEIRDASIGFFFVRGERNPWLLTQGALIPTLRVANTEYFIGGGGGSHYYDIYNTDAEIAAYGHVPCIDNLLEAFRYDEVGGSADPDYVVDEFYQLAAGYMPVYINDMRSQYGSGAVQNYSTKHWALLAGEAFTDEPATITNLLRDTTYVFQLGKMSCLVDGLIGPVFDETILDSVTPNPGLHYRMQALSGYSNPGYKAVANLNYVPAETFGSGSEFISRVAMRFRMLDGGSSDRGYDVYQGYNPFFGIEMTDDLVDSSKSSTNPYAGNSRLPAPSLEGAGAHTSGTRYRNYNTTVNAAFLVNIYPSNVRPSATDLYPTVDTITYKQVTKRYSWADATTLGDVIDVFGGDCYISKVSRKLNQSTFRNPSFADGIYKQANINAGMMLTWWQESKFNLHLRQPAIFDASETEDRTFFPYKGRGDFNEYRKYRYPETSRHAKGYSENLAPKSFFPLPDNAPFIQSDYFTRAVASDKHIPNAFRNGYRSFTGINFQDYDSSLGRIVRIFNHANNLLVVFEHGIGIGPVNQRVQTGSDSSGPVFLEAKEVLPPKLAYWSREYGAQSFYSIIQTPMGIYGIDEQKNVIWQATDRVNIISDNGFRSFINRPLNPRAGYDPANSEVVFTTDQWTLAYNEDLQKFYFLPFKPSFYTRLGDEMLSFTDRFHTHSGEGFTIYGNQVESFVEFVVNQDVEATKVHDWIHLIGNEVKPSKVEFFTYSGIPQKSEVITPSGCHQYSRVLDQLDPFLGEPLIEWRDKGWLIQIPNASIYNPVPGVDSWEVDGRMRNRYLIVRITYNTQSPLQLLSVLTNYRYSAS